MPAYRLRIGHQSFVIEAFSDAGALSLTAATADEMSGEEAVNLVADADDRVALGTTVAAFRRRS